MNQTLAIALIILGLTISIGLIIIGNAAYQTAYWNCDITTKDPTISIINNTANIKIISITNSTIHCAGKIPVWKLQ